MSCLQTDGWTTGTDGSFHWPRPAHDAVWPACQTTDHSSFRSVSRFGAWKCRHNIKPVCKTRRRITKIICRELQTFHILLKIQHFILISAHRHSWGGGGVWCHSIFVSRWNVKERDTRLPEILYNLTNPTTTSTLLKCFQISVPNASKRTSTLRPLEGTMGTPLAWPVSEAWINTHNAFDIGRWKPMT